jgi:hypothetical protein
MHTHFDGLVALARARALQPGDVLSHLTYSLHCWRVAVERREVAVVWVQVRRQGGLVCGRVIGCEETERGEFFKLETERGPLWASATSTRMCSGDGRCTCEGAA